MPLHLAGKLLTAVNGPRLAIFIFHRVLGAPDPLLPGEPTSEQFDAMLRWIKRDFEVLSLGHALERLGTGGRRGPLAAITFDDGYADNFDIALPLLKKHGVHATFFIASGFLDGGRMWNDTIREAIRRTGGETLVLSHLGLGDHFVGTEQARRHCIDTVINKCKYQAQAVRGRLANDIAQVVGCSLPEGLMMTSAQVAALNSAGMEIGAHTRTHPILAEMSDEDARHEIEAGRADLQAIVQVPVTLFAYPNGMPVTDYGSSHVELVRRLGFAAAVSTAWGCARPESDRYQLPRFSPWDRDHWRFRLRATKNLLRRADVIDRAQA